ncbi:MAG: methyltransferase domain-containing protein [Egibacteraceae bacterium]
MTGGGEAPRAGRGGTEPSAWVRRFAERIPAGGTVLDLACGRGRHTRLLLALGHPVVAVDRDVSAVADLDGALEVVEIDLEDGRAFPLAERRFDGLVVTAYLHRPLLGALVEAVAPGGTLIYETFSSDHARFGRPTNPDFLLHPGELLEVVRGHLRVVAYEDLVVPGPAALQRICASRDPSASTSAVRRCHESVRGA